MKCVKFQYLKTFPCVYITIILYWLLLVDPKPTN
ncbi:hypothetical protein ACJIZ3_008905 [Penstemon smallii]|uniref:Uncharacterized protein n=1 Tax=Penstemon smallii TaxID=265156 RepID=A0ABD3TB49_9LAMI